MKKSDGSATKNAAKDNTSPVEHGDWSELSNSQLRLFDNTVLRQLPDGSEETNLVIADAVKQWTQTCMPTTLPVLGEHLGKARGSITVSEVHDDL